MNRRDRTWLAELGRELNRQDGMEDPRGPSHGTAHPIYIAQRRERVYGIDPSHTDPDGCIWMHDGEECDPDETLPDAAVEVHYIEFWETVPGAVSFTSKGIEEYLAIDGHNLGEHRVFIGSARRCWQTIQLIDTLRRLDRDPSWWERFKLVLARQVARLKR